MRLKLKSGTWAGGAYATSQGGLQSYAYPEAQDPTWRWRPTSGFPEGQRSATRRLNRIGTNGVPDPPVTHLARCGGRCAGAEDSLIG